MTPRRSFRSLPARAGTLALLFALLGYRFEFLRLPGIEPVALAQFSIPVTIFWMLAIVNGLNLVDGVDGLAGGVHRQGQ